MSECLSTCIAENLEVGRLKVKAFCLTNIPVLRDIGVEKKKATDEIRSAVLRGKTVMQRRKPLEPCLVQTNSHAGRI